MHKSLAKEPRALGASSRVGRRGLTAELFSIHAHDFVDESPMRSAIYMM